MKFATRVALLVNIGSLMAATSNNSTIISKRQVMPENPSISYDDFGRFFVQRFTNLFRNVDYSENNRTINFQQLQIQVERNKENLENNYALALDLVDFLKFVEKLPACPSGEKFERFELFKNFDHLNKINEILDTIENYEKDDDNKYVSAQKSIVFLKSSILSFFSSEINKKKSNGYNLRRYIANFNSFHEEMRSFMSTLTTSETFMNCPKFVFEILQNIFIADYKHMALGHFITMYLNSSKEVDCKKDIMESCLKAIAISATSYDDFIIFRTGYKKMDIVRDSNNPNGNILNSEEELANFFLEEIDTKETVQPSKRASSEPKKTYNLILEKGGDIDTQFDAVLISPNKSERDLEYGETTELIEDSKTSESIEEEEKSSRSEDYCDPAPETDSINEDISEEEKGPKSKKHEPVSETYSANEASNQGISTYLLKETAKIAKRVMRFISSYYSIRA